MIKALANVSEIQERKREILSNLTGRNLLNVQIPLSSLLAAFPLLFVCSDMTHWHLETGQGGEGFGIHTTHRPSPPPRSFVLQPCLWGPRSDCLLQVPERHFSVCSPTQNALDLSFSWGGGGKWQAILKQIFLLLPLPFSLLPHQTTRAFLASVHHLEVYVGDLSLLLFTVNSPEIKGVAVVSSGVSCSWATGWNAWSWLYCGWWFSYNLSPCSCWSPNCFAVYFFFKIFSFIEDSLFIYLTERECKKYLSLGSSLP